MRKFDASDILAVRRTFGLTLKTSLDLVCYGVVTPPVKGNAEESSSRLDALGREIMDGGITPETLYKIRTVSNDIKYGTTILERYPQSVLPGLRQGSEALISAAVVCRGCPQTESEFRQIYCTDDLVAEGLIQEKLVEDWSRLSGLWFQDADRQLSGLAEIVDSGTESKVYFFPSKRIVYKTISLKHYNVLRLALDRIVIHNAVFPLTAMDVIGFGRNGDGEFVIVVKQTYISGTKPTEKERAAFMSSLGFEEAGEDYGMHLNYRTRDIYIGDVNEYNAIKCDDTVMIIDADCRINTPTLGCGGSFEIFPYGHTGSTGSSSK